MNPIVLSSLIPVVLLITIGFVAGRAGYIRAEATKDLATLVFTVLTPALLFRTMSTVHVERLDFKPVAVYFAAAILLFAAMLFWQGATRRAAVVALAATFSNTVAIGVPPVGLAYGEAGRVTLFTLISIHTLVMLTLATVVLELAVAHEAASKIPPDKGAMGLTLLKNLVMPALVAAIGWAVGLTGLPLTLMIVAASLPIGANVFMFSKRYEVAEELITAGVAVSTALTLLTVSLVMALVNCL